MSSSLQRLIDFHRASSELAATRELLQGVPDDMRALHDEHSAAMAELQALEAQLAEARSARSAAEGAIADAQERLRKFQAQVPRVRNQREYGALLTEIDGAKADIRRLEEEALRAIEAAESAESELSSRRESFTELGERYAAGLAEWEKRKPDVARRAAELEADAERLRGELPRPVIAQYVRIAERYRGGALAELRRAETGGNAQVWFCSSCNYQVRPQVAVEVRTRGSIVQCEGCRRFFHVEMEE